MGKFEKQNRPASQPGYPPQGTPRGQGSGYPPQGSPQGRGAGYPPQGSPRGQAPKIKTGKKKNKALLPIILGALVVSVGVVAGLLCMKFFGKAPDPVKDQIAPDVYIAGVNVGGLEKEAALDLLMQTYPPLTPPATTVEGMLQGPVLARVYTGKNMNIRVYTTPEETVLYTGTYDPTPDIPVDIYGKPLEGATEATEETSEETTEEGSEGIETTDPTGETAESTGESTASDTDAPLTEDGTAYILHQTIVLPASQVNPTLDLTAAVDAAYAIGRDGGPEAQKEPMELELGPYLTLDEAYIRDVLDRAYEDTLLPGSPTLVEKGKTTVVGEDGTETEADCLHITFGSMSRELDTDTLFDSILTAYDEGIFDLQAIYEETLPTTLDLNQVYTEAGCHPAVNAVCDPKTFAITEETVGYGFHMQDALALAENAQPGDQITLPLLDIIPQHRKAEMEKLLFSDILGSCVSPHVWFPDRTRNLELAAQAINGTILLPGEEFSFNRIVGERTAEKGYKEAGVYVGGRTENQLGGGVCQVASAIYYSCLKADLKITERYEHQYVPSYVPWGMDATIYWGALDYRFINNTPYPIRIESSVHDGAVYINLVGTETRNYTVKLDYSIIDEDKAEEVTLYIHPSMKDYHKFSGYKTGETVQTAYDGYKVKTYMYKYDLDGNYLETIWINTSNYDRRDKEIAHVLDPNRPMKEQIEELENPTEPPETEPPETEPPETD
ncbi:MAG: VanW family protein, partial [Oscillospiraceae bacterium]|nr:VanW family protein [Oscillospiraceae bacterium]